MTDPVKYPRFSALWVDQKMSDAEDSLSKAARFPIVGIVPGVIKVAMGTIQAITAVALAIFKKLAGNREGSQHAVEHVKHGFGNIAAGGLEAIPGVGSLMYYVLRGEKKVQGSDRVAYVKATHSQMHKFMPYELLKFETMEIKIAGLDDRLVELAKKKYEAITTGQYWLPDEKCRKLMQQAIQEAATELDAHEKRVDAKFKKLLAAQGGVANVSIFEQSKIRKDAERLVNEDDAQLADSQAEKSISTGHFDSNRRVGSEGSDIDGDF